MFGVKRIPLPKDDYGLDEDGWIDVRAFATARMSLLASQPFPDEMARVETLMKVYITGWSIAMNGESMPYKPELALDLPWQVLEALTGEIQRLPLSGKSSRNGSHEPSSSPVPVP